VPGARTRHVTLDPGASADTPVRIKGQAEACPDRTRAIPCTVRAVTGQLPAETARGSYSYGEPQSSGELLIGFGT